MTTLVTFPIAKSLKEKWFDINGEYQNYYIEKNYYDEDGNLIDCDEQSGSLSLFEGKYNAPTIAEVIMRLYEERSLWILALPTVTGYFAYKIIDVQDNPEKPIERPPYKDVSAHDYNSPAEAYEAAIEYCLTNLLSDNNIIDAIKVFLKNKYPIHSVNIIGHDEKYVVVNEKICYINRSKKRTKYRILLDVKDELNYTEATILKAIKQFITN